MRRSLVNGLAAGRSMARLIGRNGAPRDASRATLDGPRQGMYGSLTPFVYHSAGGLVHQSPSGVHLGTQVPAPADLGTRLQRGPPHPPLRTIEARSSLGGWPPS